MLRLPLKPGLVRDLCTRVRNAFHDPSIGKTDQWGAGECDFYSNAELALPENMAWLYAFVEGLLGLEVGVDSTLRVHGTEVPMSGAETEVPLDAGIAHALPPEVHSLRVDGLNVFGRRVGLNCTLFAAPLRCSAAVSEEDGEGAAPANAAGKARLPGVAQKGQRRKVVTDGSGNRAVVA